MFDRTEACTRFLADTGYAAGHRAPVSGDASNRRYERINTGTGSVILMDAPAEKGEDVRPFIRIARHLRAIGLSAPEILSEDPEDGFLILEDLGDDLYARLLKPLEGADLRAQENRLYSAATDVLVALHRAPYPADLPRYADVMPNLAALPFDWYLPALGMSAPDARSALVGTMADALAGIARAMPEVMILRDYHAENLLWLPDRDGPARVGLLDFQDAMVGHPAYDLVSMLQDARREVLPETETAMIARYCDATGAEPEAFTRAYRLLGLQRNMRILGVFARLCLRDGKPHYVDLIPRVWGHLQRDLDDPSLAAFAAILRPALPEPTPDRLKTLKDLCGTRRTA
ncbi:aminoglycoside phosphotransferase family protein [Oceanicola sp. 22II-s10i]|uniref:aminoglycoside phosphotransferase family protein n=1 Tax=Oceanicola sp. 22II-s10i TaxID=1317116 RepID=UPI0020CBD7F2|nr:phosphotransferase [Oceanicola sp. 22II-s10i]